MSTTDALLRLLGEHPSVSVRKLADDDWTASACGCMAHGASEDEARAQLQTMLRRLAALQAEQAERDAERARARAVACERRARTLRAALRGGA